MTTPQPKAFLFDWDNTLVDTWGAIHHALAATFRAMGQRPWTLEETRQRVRASARDTFPALFGDRSEAAMEIFYRIFESDHLESLREREGAGDMLRALAADGRYYMAVVSNKKGELLRREAAHLDWARYFTRLVGANDAPRDKPAVEAVELALRGSGLAPGPAVWFVGDTDIDMRCAVNAGCFPVLVRPHAPQGGEFGDTEPGIHVSSCARLLAAVGALSF